MRKKKGQRLTGTVALSLTLFGGLSAQAVNYTWTNAGGDNSYLNTNNWAYDDTTVATNLPSVNGDVASINLNGADRLILTASTPGNINSIDVGSVSGESGEIEQNDGLAKATANASRYSRIGNNGGTGLWTLNGGTAELNRCDIGRAGGVGSVVVNGGVFKVSRGNSGYSLRLDITGDAGITQGSFEISGGTLSTRVGVLINDYGTFTVKGSAPSILIGGAGTGDSFWNQTTSGTLAVQVAATGLAPIEIDNDAGGSTATFASGSILEPSFLGGYVETNAWVVMASEGPITDNGLMLADGVDSDWDFGVELDPNSGNNLLWIGYAGGRLDLEQPPTTTNLFVDAIVDTPDTWNLFAPEGGSTALSDQSSSGFSVNVDTVTDWLARPVVAQEFGVDMDISEVGQSITVNFDVEVLDNVTIPNGEDFRFAFYDTNQNYQIIAGMLDFGMPQGTTMKIRIDEKVSYSNPSDESDDPTYTFVPGEYAGLCNGSTTLGQASTAPGSGIQIVGSVTHIESVISRTDSNEISVVTYWSDNSYTSTCSAVINEDAPDDPDGMPYSGKYEVLNGFGFKIFADAPYTPDGRYKISNYELSYTTAIPAGFSYSIADMTLAPSGDLTITLTDPIVGAVYTAQGTTDLVNSPMAEIGSYVSVAPGVITIPAADAAPYLTGEGFFNVELPVYEIVE